LGITYEVVVIDFYLQLLRQGNLWRLLFLSSTNVGWSDLLQHHFEVHLIDLRCPVERDGAAPLASGQGNHIPFLVETPGDFRHKFGQHETAGEPVSGPETSHFVPLLVPLLRAIYSFYTLKHTYQMKLKCLH